MLVSHEHKTGNKMNIKIKEFTAAFAGVNSKTQRQPDTPFIPNL